MREDTEADHMPAHTDTHTHIKDVQATKHYFAFILADPLSGERFVMLN